LSRIRIFAKLATFFRRGGRVVLTRLATEELDLEDLFRASANAYVIFDRDLVIVGCNDAYLRAVGRQDSAEILGRPVFEAFPVDPASDSFRILWASLQRVLATNRPDHIAVVPYDTSRPGEPPATRYWSATHTPLRNRQGGLAYILQHTVDVTELQTLRARDARGNIAESGVLARAQAVQASRDRVLAEMAQLRDLFAQAPGFLAVLTGPEHVFHLANDAYRRLVGRDNLIGRSLAEALPEVVGQGFVELLDRARMTGEPYVGAAVPVFLLPAGGGGPELRHVDFVCQPIRDAEGGVSGILMQGHDVTEQWRAQRDLARQTELLLLAQDGGGFGTYDWDLARGTVSGSRLFRRLFGLEAGPQEAPLAEILARIHPEDADDVATFSRGALPDVETPHEFRLMIDGRVTWIGAQGTVVRDPAGRPERVLGAVHDLTDRKQSETRLDMLARESAHRVKNILTIMQIVCENTLRRAPSLDAARDSLRDRIAALNQAQMRILAGPEDCRLDSLVRDALSVAATADGRIVVDGIEDAELAPRTGLGLALALHELATNAMKYGALSVAGGTVAIDWRLQPLDVPDAVTVTLDWRERGGPPVAAERRSGFGSMLIRTSLAHDPHGRADWSPAPDGVRCQLVFTARAVAAPERERALAATLPL
jgi:PAS domain S-box-containing protein